jgi:SagB-type dehydrogenase family enzyme
MPADSVIPLPGPRLDGPMSLEETLSRRRSVRFFGSDPVSLADVAQLLWASQGIIDPSGKRTAPSAGALYPLESYAVTPDGIFHYDPAAHALVAVRSGDHREELYNAALMMDSVRRAPLTIVLAAVYARTEVRYGRDRAPRYVHLEAGHAAQDILLQAVALGLGAVPIGAFLDEEVGEVLGLAPDQSPLYMVSIGHPE